MQGNFIEGRFFSKTAKNLIKEWANLHRDEIEENWKNARAGVKLKKIDPLE